MFKKIFSCIVNKVPSSQFEVNGHKYVLNVRPNDWAEFYKDGSLIARGYSNLVAKQLRNMRNTGTLFA